MQRLSLPSIIGRRPHGRDHPASAGPDGLVRDRDRRAVVVLGGGSGIGLAIARALVERGAETVVLAGRDREAMRAQAEDIPARIETVPFDARATDSHVTAVEEAFTLAGPVQAAIVAFAVLGDTDAYEHSPTLAGGAATVNFAGAVSASLAAARAIERQGTHGTLIVLSSAAILRPRRANYIYGAAKAGLDFFARGLADSYRGRVRVLLVRPGFVRTKMTSGLTGRGRGRLATTPDRVAADVVHALDRGAAACWSPGMLRFLRWPIQAAPSWLMRRVVRE